MARPREFDEDVILAKLKDVFWNYGYEGTSYPALIAASGLQKGSLYAAFGDKKSLYLRTLQAYIESEVAGATGLLSGTGDSSVMSGTDRITSLLDAVIQAVTVHKDRRGCLLCNAAVDQAPDDKDVETIVSNGLDTMQIAFQSALSETMTGLKMVETASMLNAVYFGMRVMAKSGVPVLMLQQARDGAVELISSID